MSLRRFMLILAVGCCCLGCAWAQSPLQTPAARRGSAARRTPAPPPKVVAGIPVNYDQAKVGTYTLPDALRLPNGQRVTSATTWYNVRRPQILHLFEEDQYGSMPGRPAAMTFDVFDKGTPVFNGAAIRKQVTIYFSSNKNGPHMDLAVYVPAKAKKPVPLLLNISFTPNPQSMGDPTAKPGSVWNAKLKQRVPMAANRPSFFGALPAMTLLKAGFGVAAFNYADVDPDALGAVAYGVRALYLKPGQTEPAPDAWGAISAWAWGASRALDYLETDPSVDAHRVALYGVSRLGKTVLWTAAHDQRFALVIDSCSGEGGASLNRRDYGETVKLITLPSRYGYQFAGNFATYADRVDQLPMDSDMLLDLIAPRPVLLQTGDQDLWSDPKGTFVAAVAAGPVYKLLGADGLDTTVWPPAGTAILHTLGYEMHHGGHGTMPSDWPVYMKFLEMHLHPNS